MKLKVDNPIFKKSYCEFGAVDIQGQYYIDDPFFQLQYITNIDDKRYVTEITLKQAESSKFYITEYGTGYGSISYDEKDLEVNKYGRYAIHTIYISCSDLKFKENEQEIICTDATVKFNDGTKMDIDLGKIILYKEKKKPVAIEDIGYSSSSEGDSSIIFRVKEDVKIDKIESELLEYATDVFDFKVTYVENNKNNINNYESGKVIKANSVITITSNLKQSNDILKKYALYDIKPKIHFSNEFNDKYIYRYDNMSSSNFLNQEYFYNYSDIYRFLKEKGAL